ncbi:MULTISPECIES: sensor histidine kinase [Streptomyces]|uniref:histidine kinase n=1 Tax=Streptomyces thermoviolaceus subsp. thermoviolaceus TaxID=66860 RepID=A0ABX0YV06_STRTL|nr:histidine kinase [Streptomyces thermoviolaceus]MCM3264730.1 histidine kinase [Streptomyces thermoviolaceus]NJP16406.1 sensor histidine kinase [Streptomyces thermoviolaceus subsp. thermoviolaceus]GHB08951.1 histidine kinase [Streptomyces thermoviolaceus subsp. thermoviolaceus]
MTRTGDDRQAAGTGPWWWARWRSAVLDVGLALVSAAECAAEGVPFAREAGVPVAVGVVLGLLAGSVLLVRRRWPIAVVLVAIAVTPARMGFLLGVVGLYTLAACELPRRVIGALAGMSFLGTMIVTFVRVGQDMARGDFTIGNWFVPFAAVTTSIGLTAPPLLLGLYVGARRRLMESLRERADSLERELQLLAERAEERAEWARSEERTRIAREMHDVVAHRVSLMVVHAAALQAVARKDPEKAARNAALVADMGRQALTELREMLGVLRSSDGGRSVRRERAVVPAPAPAPARESVGPAAVGEAVAAGVSSASVGSGEASAGVVRSGEGPSLAELEELVGQSAAAGMAVDLSVEGEVRSYGREIEQTAYRVVQEALTNVHKHAAGAKTHVRLAHRGSEIAMQVENEPPPEPASAESAGLPSGGNGLVGMRERVVALGGVFVSGPTEAGGFKVSAVIPASS